jgi:spermidine synthase
LKEIEEIPEMIMHRGLTNFAQKSAEIITQNGGNILEIGFGMGISSTFIINENITSYTCVEINDNIFSDAQNWSIGKNNVSIINSDWEDFLLSTGLKFDAIFCDCLEQDEFDSFYEKSKRVLNNGAIISCYGSGVYLENDNMNIYDTIPNPEIFDEDFTQDIFERLNSKNFYKIYWQFFDGTSYVKTLS